ncbi:hypothetical protein AB0J14_04335 [Micromonospora arborensis]|uniref:hypothetical protein n=1 Tax=Micromonospora arborensis TaxID=2116518 RepID=UPI0033F5CC70
MTASGFSRDSVPSMPESEARASHAEWQRVENRRLWWLIARCAAVAFVVLPVAYWLINGGEFA